MSNVQQFGALLGGLFAVSELLMVVVAYLWRANQSTDLATTLSNANVVLFGVAALAAMGLRAHRVPSINIFGLFFGFLALFIVQMFSLPGDPPQKAPGVWLWYSIVLIVGATSGYSALRFN